jgi:hypothetical protein
MNAHSATEPTVGPVKVRPFWPVLLYVTLTASAGLALWARSAPDAPIFVARSAPWLFVAFAVGFAAYRLALVMAGRYSPFKAFSQIGIAALFSMLLLAGPGAQPADALEQQLIDRNPAVRALAAEVAGYRQSLNSAPRLRALLADVPTVAEAAHGALVRLNGGVDLGATTEAWQERFP